MSCQGGEGQRSKFISPEAQSCGSTLWESVSRAFAQPAGGEMAKVKVKGQRA